MVCCKKKNGTCVIVQHSPNCRYLLYGKIFSSSLLRGSMKGFLLRTRKRSLNKEDKTIRPGLSHEVSTIFFCMIVDHTEALHHSWQQRGGGHICILEISGGMGTRNTGFGYSQYHGEMGYNKAFFHFLVKFLSYLKIFQSGACA